MNKDFNTHGGYFAPQGYKKVDAGGSHEENPNGGVQLGVDGQGVPNMLEQNEPVYNDFVYSDNITADKDMLKKFNIPEKFAGKLYSEIADKFVDEATERPNDPISNNGMNEMLVRLADAQEEQKKVAEQKEIEKELEALSPEEQAQLMQMLAGQGQQAQQPVMAYGGMLRQFGDGGPADDTYYGGTLAPARAVAFPGKSRAWVEGEVGRKSIKKKVQKGMNDFMTEAYDVYRSNPALQVMAGAPGVLVDAIDEAAHGNYSGAAMLPFTTVGGLRFGKAAETALPIVERARRINAAGKKAEAAIAARARSIDRARKAADAASGKKTMWQKARPWVVGGIGLSGAGYGVDKIVDAYRSPYNGQPDSGYYGGEPEIVPGSFACGGKVRKFDDGGKVPVLPELEIQDIPDSDVYVPDTQYQPLDSYVSVPFMRDTSTLPTGMRYAGIVTNGLLGLYNAFQKPDSYSIRSYRPVLPSYGIQLANPVFRPDDVNRTVGDVISAGAGTARAIRNAGLGPSTGATLLASGYNTGNNIGLARMQAIAANEARLNDVIARRNANAQAYAQTEQNLNTARANVLNDAQLRNIQNELMQQRLNYEAEGQKYAAIQSNIDALAKGLAGVGQENFAFNQINSNPYYRYGYDGKTGTVGYHHGNGGLMRKYKSR